MEKKENGTLQSTSHKVLFILFKFSTDFTLASVHDSLFVVMGGSTWCVGGAFAPHQKFKPMLFFFKIKNLFQILL